MSKEPLVLKSNSKAIFELLGRMARKAQNLTRPMREITQLMLAETEKNFDTEGANAGEKWEQWSEKWRIRRLKMGYGSGKIGTLRGDLRKSLTRQVTKTSATVGTNKVYAKAFHFGNPNSKEKVGRQFMVWTEKLQNDILEAMSAYLTEEVK